MALRPIFFFDLDNCLYHRNLNVLSLMRNRIHNYFVNNVGIEPDQVVPLNRKYETMYGLSLRGLQNEYSVDPLDFDKHVDQALPLDGLIKRGEGLVEMLQRLNAKKWIFTNAYKPHALRCLKLLGVENEFDGLSYTNYLKPNFNCKPELASYMRAMKDAGAIDPRQCYFVDDSAMNIDAAKKIGWTSVHLASNASESNHGDFQIEDIHDLPNVLPELWEETPAALKVDSIPTEIAAEA